MTVIARKAEVVRPSGARRDVTEAQARTIRQLQDEEVCAGEVVETGCGWIRIDDKARHVMATIDRSGTLLGLEGLGRRQKRGR